MATLLVVDDNATNRQLLTVLLGAVGHDILEAVDGAEALNLARTRNPNLIIADILMPTMDGYEFVHQLRSDPHVPSIPVVFYTAAYQEHETRKLADSCGVQHVITKPSEPEEILNIVNAALETHPRTPQQAGDFDREHLRLLTDKLSQRTNELEIANLRLQALVEAGSHLAAARSPEELLTRLTEAAREILGARHALAGILSDDGRTVQHTHASGFDQKFKVSLQAVPLERGVLSRLIAWETPLRIDDLKSDPLAEHLPAAHGTLRSFLGVSICTPNARYGVLCLFEKLGAVEFHEQDGQVATTLAAQAAVVCENLRQQDDLHRSAHQLRRFAAGLRQAREYERARLAREIHDQLGNNLATLKSDLAQHSQRLSSGAPYSELLYDIDRISALIQSTLDTVHNIAGELRPLVLDLGLIGALQWQMQHFEARSGIRCVLDTTCEIELPKEQSSEVFWILHEILTNAGQHSGADTVRISISEDEDSHYLIEAHDNGMGILPQEASDPNAFGLLEMRERAHTIGATLEIFGELTHGTTVRLTVPK